MFALPCIRGFFHDPQLSKYLRLVPILWYFLEPTRRTRHPLAAPAKIQFFWNFSKILKNFKIILKKIFFKLIYVFWIFYFIFYLLNLYFFLVYGSFTPRPTTFYGKDFDFSKIFLVEIFKVKRVQKFQKYFLIDRFFWIFYFIFEKANSRFRSK